MLEIAFFFIFGLAYFKRAAAVRGHRVRNFSPEFIMSKTVITGRDISKAYRLGLAQPRMDFRETIMTALRHSAQTSPQIQRRLGATAKIRSGPSEIVQFDVNEGEVMA